MKIWITRTEVSTLLTRGIAQCKIWLKEPFFDTTPRGEKAGRLYAKLPVGWSVKDDDGLEASGPLCCPAGRLLEEYPDIQQAIWDAIGLSVDGQLPGKNWDIRWHDIAFDGEGRDDDGPNKFLYECEVPPALWFKIALHNGWEHETAGSRQFRERLWYDSQEDALPF